VSRSGLKKLVEEQRKDDRQKVRRHIITPVKNPTKQQIIEARIKACITMYQQGYCATTMSTFFNLDEKTILRYLHSEIQNSLPQKP
jgi:hypothetical protein